jgi:uncharacterized membrane protein
MDALTEAIVRLLKRVERIEDRLARLEPQQPAGASAAPPEAAPPFVPVIPPPLPAAEPLPASGAAGSEARPRESMRGPATPAFERGAQPPGEAADHPRLETRMGLTWINRIGVITLIIGVAFFFKYAIDNQWIGETGRVALGVLAGLAAVAAGDVLWRRGQRVFAQGLCGLGVGILYLSFYASFGFYHLLPQAAAFVLMAMVTALAGALALRYGAMAIAALGMLGGYATPVLLSTGQDAPWTFFSYIFLIDVGAVAIARPHRWRLLDLMAFLATAILYMAWFGEWFKPEKHVVATVAALAFYALFALVEWSGIFYAVQVFAGIALAAIWQDATPYLSLSLLVGAAGLVISDQTYGSDQARAPMAAAFSFATFWGAYGIWRSSNGKPEETLTIFLFLSLAFAMYLVWAPFQVLVRRTMIQTQHLTVMAVNGAAYFAYSYLLLESRYKAWLGLLAAAVAGVHLLLGMEFWKQQSRKPQSMSGRDTRPVLLALGIALGFLTLAVPIQFTGFSITVSWALEAAALVWIGLRTRESRLLFAAVAVYLFVFLRLYLLDAWMPAAGRTPVINSRVLTFVVSAVSFWLGAWWLRTRRPAAAASYVTGHFIMLSICLLEFSDWAGTAVSVENRASLLAIGVSILMALYAVLLIGIGVGYRSALDRVLGLGLIALVVLKLYLYDVWEASRLFRMAAFVTLGVLLLLTSYLYSRFRPALENWWKDEEAPK